MNFARSIVRSVAAAAAVVCVVWGVEVAAQSKTATLYARASDASGKAMTDLQPSEMQLTVDGKRGKITLETYLGGPRRVMILVSNNVPSQITLLRAGLEDFVMSLPGDAEIGLGTTAGQYHPRVDVSNDRTRLLEFVKGMPVEDGNNVTMDGLVEVSKRFLDKEARQPVIVVVTTEGSESSAVRDEVFNRFVQDFSARGGMVHVVLVSATAGGAAPRPGVSANRTIDNAILSADTSAESIISMNVTKNTGGRYELVNAITAIPEKLKEIAAEIKADQQLTDGWYKVVFAADKPPNSVRFAVDRPGTKVQLSQARPRTK